MKDSRRGFLSILGIYAAGSWLVLQIVDVLNQNLGLPPWAFSLALTLLLIGLPIVGVTAYLQSRAWEQKDSAAAVSSESGGARRLFTWRNAAISGLAAMALWGMIATAWLLQSRDSSELPAEPTGTVTGPTGFLTVETEPPGVRVEIQKVVSPESAVLGDAVDLGTAPLVAVGVPAGELVVRLEQEGWLPLTLIMDVDEADSVRLEATLLQDSPLGAGMVFVSAGPTPMGAGGFPSEAFLVDRHEVTNQEYAEFMADDGYRTVTLWPDTMTMDGSRLSRSEAISRLTDRTGAVGPRTWSGSVFQPGSADHPVTGVSWYESNAYCQWQGKRLPTFSQWWRAALGDGERPYPWGNDSESLRARANFEATGTRPVEYSPLGTSPFGTFEMAGNAREWLRPAEDEAATAPSVGGSWQDPEYTFSIEWREELPVGFANETTGFRCVRHIE